MKRKLVSIREAAEALGVSAQTLRHWEREGKLLPDERTAGEQDLSTLRSSSRESSMTFYLFVLFF